MQAIQYLIIIFALFVITRIILRLKDNQLSIMEFLMWMSLWVAVLIVAIIPSIATISARMIGIGRGADALIYIALLVLFYLMFRVIIKLETIGKQLNAIKKLSKR